MRRSSRNWLGFLALASACVVCCAAPAVLAQPYDDPVERLRLALKEDRTLPVLPDNPEAPNYEKIKQHIKNILDFRKKNLRDKIEQLKTTSDLRRALMLADWREDAPTSTDEIFQVDLGIRKVIAERFRKAIRLDVERGGRDRRMVAARIIAEIPPTFRTPGGDDHASFTRSFTDDILRLTEDPDKGVVQQALNTLGVINALPSRAADRFRSVLADRSPERADLRLLAARGLKLMMQVANNMPRTDRSKAINTKKDVLLTAQEVVPVCLLVLKDSTFEWRVHAACLDAVGEAALGLQGIVEAFTENKDVPPSGRPLSDMEVETLVQQYETLREEFKQTDPYFKLFRDAAPHLAAALADANAPVRLAAIEALSIIANARLVRSNRLAILPLDKRTEEKLRNEKGGLIVIEDPFAELLQKWYPQVLNLRCDASPLIRLKMFEFVEKLEMDAAPALPVLVEGLQFTDPRDFVPLVATRAIRMLVILENLRRMAGKASRLSDDDMRLAVPGLGKLLFHPELTFRQEAAETLEAMGKLAEGARGQLSEAIRSGGPEGRLPIFPIIARLRPEDAQVLVPDLAKNLNHADARVREAAAKTLGKIGPLAAAAVRDLRRLALGDADSDARIAACDALLSILPPPE